MSNSVKKLTLNYDGHTTTINATSYTDLLTHASKHFSIPPRQVGLSYVDDEGDSVSIKSDMELTELFRMGGPEFDLNVKKQLLDSSMVLPTHTEDDMLNQIRNQLKAINTSFENFAGSRNEHIKKMKQSSEYEELLKSLKIANSKLEDDNRALRSTIEEKDRIIQNKDIDVNKIKSELVQNKDANQKLGLQIQLKIKEFFDLKKEKESIAYQHQYLQAKFDALQKDIDHKTQENLQLSKVVFEVKAEKEALEKTTHTLKHQLEVESQEKEKLQQSLFMSTRFPDVPQNNHDDVDLDHPKTTEKEWENELSILENIGYKDRQNNLQLLIKLQDMSQVVSHYKALIASQIPELQPSPAVDEPYSVDVLVLESMGFFDKEKNIGYLKQFGSVEAAINQLLAERDM